LPFVLALVIGLSFNPDISIHHKIGLQRLLKKPLLLLFGGSVGLQPHE